MIFCLDKNFSLINEEPSSKPQITQLFKIQNCHLKITLQNVVRKTQANLFRPLYVNHCKSSPVLVQENKVSIMDSDVIMSAVASQITGVTTVYRTVCSGEDHRKHQSSASLAFVMGIHRWPVNSPHKGSDAENISIWWRHLYHWPCGLQHKSMLTIDVWDAYAFTDGDDQDVPTASVTVHHRQHVVTSLQTK